MDAKVWSIYGAERAQPMATGRKWDGRENGSNARKPLPWVATGCRSGRMVRRGSTVRVRQRALEERKYPEIRGFVVSSAPRSTSLSVGRQSHRFSSADKVPANQHVSPVKSTSLIRRGSTVGSRPLDPQVLETGSLERARRRKRSAGDRFWGQESDQGAGAGETSAEQSPERSVASEDNPRAVRSVRPDN
jgi:hypothetical protein